MAMKISPSVIAAAETLLATAPLTIEAVNQCAQEKAALALTMTIQETAYGDRHG